jgi:hypothetical protein
MSEESGNSLSLSEIPLFFLALYDHYTISTTESETNSTATVLDTDLFASFPSCFHGKAELVRDAKGQCEFSVEVAGFPSGHSLEVHVAGVVVGTMTIDACGVGKLDLADVPEQGEGELPFPANFPELTGGERVQVGPLRGQLRTQD